MKKKPSTVLCAATGLSVLVSCSAPSSNLRDSATTAAPAKDSRLSGKIVHEVNSYRATKGKAALVRHSGLDRLAQAHCDFLAMKEHKPGDYKVHVGHEGFESRAFIAKHAYGITSMGENVVASSKHSPKHLVVLWSKSPTHNSTMCDEWTYTGVATAVEPDGLVISTQLFGITPVAPGGAKAGMPLQ
jgi:uncharacterized protein YkwD